MATKIASLFIELAANGAELTKELKKSRKQVSTWGGQIADIGIRTARVLAGVTTSLVATNAALAIVVSRNTDYVSSLDNVAKKLGDTTQNLQVLQFAGKQQEIQQSAINTGLQRFTRRLSEAALGTGEARGALRELGVDAVALNQKLPTDALQEVLNRLQLIPNQSDRVRIAFKLFDTEGVDFVRLAGNLGTARAELETMNGVLSDIDVANITALDQSLIKIRTLAETIGLRFTAKVSPALTAFTDNLFQAGLQGEELEKVMDSAIKLTLRGTIGLLKTASAIISFVSSNPDVVQFGAIGFLVFGKKGALIGSILGGINQKLTEAFDAVRIRTFGTETEKLQRRLAQLEERLSDVSRLQAEFPDSSLFTTGVDQALTEIDEVRSRLKALGVDTRLTLDVIGSSGGVIASTGEILANTADTVASELEKILASLDNAQTQVVRAPQTGRQSAANDPTAPDTAAETAQLALQTEQLRSFYAEQDQQLADANQRMRLRFGQQVQIIGDSQGRWTKFAESGAKTRFQILSGELGSALAASGQHSKRLFKLNKVVSIANAVLSGGQAAANALATRPFFPTGLAMLSVAVAKTASIISGLKKTKFSGGATVINASGGAGGAPTANNDINSAGGANVSLEDQDGSGDNGLQQYVTLNVFVEPGTTQAEADRAAAEALARNLKAERITADAIVSTNIINEGRAA